MNESERLDRDVIELPPWGRDERDLPESLAERIRLIKERIRLIRDRRER